MFTIIITLKIAISMVNMSVKISNVECEENEDCTKACPDEEGRCIPHCVISPTGGKCTYGNLIIANLDEILEVEEDNRKQGVISAKSVWELFIGVKKVCDKIWQKFQYKVLIMAKIALNKSCG